jgi:segregation and condensation protein B
MELSHPDDPRRSLVLAVEGVIFAADAPASAQRIADALSHVHGQVVPVDSVHDAINQLNAAYAATGRVLRIHFWSGGYRMATEPVAAPYIDAFRQEDRRLRLSRALLETVAVLAYRQPVTKSEVDFVRGVDSDYTIRRLLELGLVDVVGRAETVGKPLLYGTTSRFLELFGLAGTEDLPSLREIEELLNDPAFNRERARLLALDLGDLTPGTELEPPSTS